MKKVCTFNDADIYENDLNLFHTGGWLNGSCIHYCLQCLDSPTDFLLLDPAVVSFLRLQCENDEDFADFKTGNALDSKTWVFIPVNDNQFFGGVSSHWSLMVWHIPSRRFWHMDSCRDSNLSAAITLGKILCSFMYKDFDSRSVFMHKEEFFN